MRRSTLLTDLEWERFNNIKKTLKAFSKERDTSTLEAKFFITIVERLLKECK